MQSGEHVAQPGNQTDDAVETESNPRSGNAKRFIEQNLDSLQSLVAEDPRAAIPAVPPHRSRRRREGRHGLIRRRNWAVPLLSAAAVNCFDATIDRVHGGYSSAAERLTVAQDVVGSIPTSRPISKSISFAIHSSLSPDLRGGHVFSGQQVTR